MDRRTLFRWLIKGGTLIIGGIIGIPALITGIAPALQRRWRDEWREVARLEELGIGRVHEAEVDPSVSGWPVSLRPQKVYVWRRSAQEVVVFSRTCTDLGCPVTFDRGSACYFCPCHGGIFAIDGARMAGPPQRPLDRYAVRIRNGIVEIDLGSIPPMS